MFIMPFKRSHLRVIARSVNMYTKEYYVALYADF